MAHEYGYINHKKRMTKPYGPKFYKHSLSGNTGFYGLPHRCDEWTIGDEEDVQALISDLQELIRNES